MIFSLVFEPQLYQILNIPLGLHNLASEYLSVIRWALVIQLFSIVLYYFVQVDGLPILASGALILGALVNIVLDFCFVAHLQLGMLGAAYATLLAQCLQLVILSVYFFSSERSLTFSLHQTQWSELVNAAYNGLSEFINETSAGLVFLLINYLVITRLGVAGVAAFSVINYFIFLSLMLCYGIADALHLLISQNYGANNQQRVKQFLIIGVASAFILANALLLILWQWQIQAIRLFLDDDAKQVAELSSHILLLIWPLFWVNGLNIVLSCYLTAIQQPKHSAYISLARSFVFPKVC